MHAHNDNDNWGSTTIAIDWNGYDREMKTPLQAKPRDNIIKFRGYYVQWWGTVWNFSVQTMVDVECNLLDLGQWATPWFWVVNVVGMCGLYMYLGGGISCLQNWTWHRISCCLIWDARCCNRRGLSMIGKQHTQDGNWVRQNIVQLKQMAMECNRIKVQKIKREVYWVAKIKREVECRVIGRMGEYLRITPESFSDYLYKYSKTDIVQQRMYLLSRTE